MTKLYNNLVLLITGVLLEIIIISNNASVYDHSSLSKSLLISSR